MAAITRSAGMARKEPSEVAEPQVAVTIEQPSDRGPGRVSFGRYAVHGDYVVMYGENDEPMTSPHGNRYEMLISDDAPPEVLAAILTKRIRCELSVGSDGFSGPLELPDEQFV